MYYTIQNLRVNSHVTQKLAKVINLFPKISYLAVTGRPKKYSSKQM